MAAELTYNELLRLKNDFKRANKELMEENDNLREQLAGIGETAAWILHAGATDRVVIEITNNPERAHLWKCSNPTFDSVTELCVKPKLLIHVKE